MITMTLPHKGACYLSGQVLSHNHLFNVKTTSIIQ